jgi:hypothetical protein
MPTNEHDYSGTLHTATLIRYNVSGVHELLMLMATLVRPALQSSNAIREHCAQIARPRYRTLDRLLTTQPSLALQRAGTIMARAQPNLYASLQSLFSSRVHVRDSAAAAARGASDAESGGDFVEIAVTPEELPAELKEALSRTLALVAGTTNARDTRRILQDHYSM